MAIKINNITVIDDSRVGNLAAATATGNIVGGNITTGGLISAAGNITGNYIFGNGSQLTGIDATSIQNGSANVRTFLNGNVTVSAAGTANVLTVTSTGANITGTVSATGNATVGNLSATNVTGTLATAAQPNITSVGTLTSLNSGAISSSGNVTGANFLTSGLISATGNVTGGGITLSGNTILAAGSTLTIDPATTGQEGTVIINGNLSVTGNVTYIDSTTITTNEKDIVLANNVNTQSAVNGAGLLLGNNSVVTWTYNNTSNAWVSNVGVSAAGNISGNYLFGNGSQLTGIDATSIQNGTSSVSVIASGGNVRTNIGGATVSTVYSGGLLVTGLISSTGNVAAGNLSGTNIVGTLTTAAQTNITSVGTLSSLSVTGNVQAGNFNTAGLISATGAITGAAITGTSLTVSTGSVTLGSIINANANGVGNIGNSTGYFNTIFAKATSAQYADLAEMYTADQILEPGTVVCFGGSQEVTVCDQDSSRRVAGVVSTNPSYIMNAGLSGDHVVAVALTGRVPTRVTGSVRKGDMMVSAGGGRARSESEPQLGTVIGKALADFDGADGVIEVVIGRL